VAITSSCSGPGACGGALGDERVAGGEQPRGGGERAVEDGAVDPVLEQALLAPHVRDPHPARHLRAVPLQPLPCALLGSRHRPVLLLLLRLHGRRSLAGHRRLRWRLLGLGRPSRRRPVVRSGDVADRRRRRLLQLARWWQRPLLRARLRVGRRHAQPGPFLLHALDKARCCAVQVQLAASSRGGKERSGKDQPGIGGSERRRASGRVEVGGCC